MKSLTQHINEHLITESKQGFSAEDFWFAMDEYFDYEVDREDIGSTYISGNKIEFQAESKKYKDAALEILKKKTKSVKSDGLNVKWNPEKSDIINESAKKSIKSYSDVKVGDSAFENPDAGGEWNNKIGKIVWKGLAKDLPSNMKNLVSDWDMSIKNIDKDYDVVVVKDPMYGNILMNYNNDPSGCVVFESLNDDEDINENSILNESAKYSDKLVQAAISYSTGKDFDTIYEISDESKGYSYKVKGKLGYSTVSYSDINDIIDNHKDSLKKKFSLVNESAKQTLWDWFDQNIDDFKSASAYLKAGQKVGFKKEDLMSISDDFEQYSEKEFESDKVKKEYSMLSK